MLRTRTRSSYFRQTAPWPLSPRRVDPRICSVSIGRLKEFAHSPTPSTSRISGRLHRFIVREVEARSTLSLTSEPSAQRVLSTAQRRVHQVRRSGSDGCAARFIYAVACASPTFIGERPQVNFAVCATNRLTIFLRRPQRNPAPFSRLIANLTARFRIEWGLIQHDNSFLSRVNRFNRFTIDKMSSHFAVQFQMVITFLNSEALST